MTNLTTSGGLTQSQMDEANKAGIPYMNYRDVVLQQIADESEVHIKNNNKTLHSQSKKPIIIVGHGPRWEEEAIKIKGTKIPIIATDICSIPLMDMGIMPTYICTYESAHKLINEKLFDFNRINKHSVQVIGSNITMEWMEKELEKIDMDLYRYDTYNAHDVSNVGIFSCMFAEEKLECDTVILIGMNCWETRVNTTLPAEKRNPYINWYVHWRKYISQLPDNYIINCTKGGLLYGRKILDCDFNNLVIE